VSLWQRGMIQHLCITHMTDTAGATLRALHLLHDADPPALHQTVALPGAALRPRCGHAVGFGASLQQRTLFVHPVMKKAP